MSCFTRLCYARRHKTPDFRALPIVALYYYIPQIPVIRYVTLRTLPAVILSSAYKVNLYTQNGTCDFPKWGWAQYCLTLLLLQYQFDVADWHLTDWKFLIILQLCCFVNGPNITDVLFWFLVIVLFIIFSTYYRPDFLYYFRNIL